MMCVNSDPELLVFFHDETCISMNLNACDGLPACHLTLFCLTQLLDSFYKCPAYKQLLNEKIASETFNSYEADKCVALLDELPSPCCHPVPHCASHP